MRTSRLERALKAQSALNWLVGRPDPSVVQSAVHARKTTLGMTGPKVPVTQFNVAHAATVEGSPCEAPKPRLSRQPRNKEEVGVEHVEPGKDQHQAAGDLQHSLRTPQARAAFEPAHRRRTKDDRDGAANTES